LTDVSALKTLTNLKDLDLAVNDIADIAPLAGLTSLEYLDVSSNAITDITPLGVLTNLREVGIANNHVSDLSALVANPGIGAGVRLWVSGQEPPLDCVAQAANLQALSDRAVVMMGASCPWSRAPSGEGAEGAVVARNASKPTVKRPSERSGDAARQREVEPLHALAETRRTMTLGRSCSLGRPDEPGAGGVGFGPAPCNRFGGPLTEPKPLFSNWRGTWYGVEPKGRASRRRLRLAVPAPHRVGLALGRARSGSRRPLPRKSTPTEPVVFEVESPDGCADAPSFFGAVQQRTRRICAPDGAGQERHFRVRITRTGTLYEGTLSVADRSGEGSERRVSGATCQEVVDALSVIAALAIDPEARVLSSSVGRFPLEEAKPDAFLSTPESHEQEVPEAPPPPKEPPRPRAETASPEPDARLPSRRTSYAFLVGLSAGLDAGVARHGNTLFFPTAGLLGEVRFRRNSWLRPRFFLLLRGSWPAEASAPSGAPPLPWRAPAWAAVLSRSAAREGFRHAPASPSMLAFW